MMFISFAVTLLDKLKTILTRRHLSTRLNGEVDFTSSEVKTRAVLFWVKFSFCGQIKLASKIPEIMHISILRNKTTIDLIQEDCRNLID